MRLLIAGVSLLALAGVARSADLPSAAAVDPERFGWDGAYVGVLAGYAWLQNADHAFTPALDDEGEGWTFGAHAGSSHNSAVWSRAPNSRLFDSISILMIRIS